MPAEVIVVTDRDDGGDALRDAVGRHFACTVLRPGDGFVEGDEAFALVVDMSLDVPASVAYLRALRARSPAGTQVLIVMRSDDRRGRVQAQAVGGSMFLHPDIEPPSVAARLLQLAVARTDGVDERMRAAVLGAQGACAALANIFEAANAGTRIDRQMVETGTRSVLEAIEQGGIANWLEAVRAYDDRIYQHSLMVAGLAAAFASTLGFPAADRLRLTRAALVHDVGKAKIPISILRKAGRLEPYEVSIVRTHASLGHRMLKEAGVSDPAMLDVALSHHERLDGSGYPEGLQGEEIGDFVRLVSVCDVYAALLAPRPPRPSYDIPAALTELEREAAAGRLEGAIVAMFARTFAPEPPRPEPAPYGTAPH
jgi:putative nucleotidyltransferase with HDIG domain